MFGFTQIATGPSRSALVASELGISKGNRDETSIDMENLYLTWLLPETKAYPGNQGFIENSVPRLLSVDPTSISNQNDS